MFFKREKEYFVEAITKSGYEIQIGKKLTFRDAMDLRDRILDENKKGNTSIRLDEGNVTFVKNSIEIIKISEW